MTPRSSPEGKAVSWGGWREGRGRGEEESEGEGEEEDLAWLAFSLPPFLDLQGLRLAELYRLLAVPPAVSSPIKVTVGGPRLGLGRFDLMIALCSRRAGRVSTTSRATSFVDSSRASKGGSV